VINALPVQDDANHGNKTSSCETTDQVQQVEVLPRTWCLAVPGILAVGVVSAADPGSWCRQTPAPACTRLPT